VGVYNAEECMVVLLIQENVVDHRCCFQLLSSSFQIYVGFLIRPPGTLVPKAFCFSRDVFFIF